MEENTPLRSNLNSLQRNRWVAEEEEYRIYQVLSTEDSLTIFYQIQSYLYYKQYGHVYQT